MTLDVQARKVVVDQAGVETEVPMDDAVEVGVFAEGEASVQKHRIRSGKQTITVTVPASRRRRHRPLSPADRNGEVDKNVTTIRLEE